MDAITTAGPTHSLRERMLQDMTMRGFGAHTQKDYIRHVRSFAAFLGRPPDTATMEDLRRYQVDQHERAVGPATINGAVSALRFLFGITLKRPEMALGLVVVRCMPKLRVVLSVEETARLLEAAPGIKYKAALSVAYGAGLRVSEVAHLKVDDIDSNRMMIRTSRPSPAMPMLRRAHDHHRGLRPLVPAPRAAIIGIANPGECAMIRHGSGCTTVTPMASWPMTQCMPIPEASPAHGALTSKTTTVRTLTPHKVTLIRPEPTLPDPPRLPVRTTPKPLYP